MGLHTGAGRLCCHTRLCGMTKYKDKIIVKVWIELQRLLLEQPLTSPDRNDSLIALVSRNLRPVPDTSFSSLNESGQEIS